MMELKNEFSWSKTRDEVFTTCPRQHWFTYCGYWNGWLENAPVRTRRIYILESRLKIPRDTLEEAPRICSLF